MKAHLIYFINGTIIILIYLLFCFILKQRQRPLWVWLFPLGLFMALAYTNMLFYTKYLLGGTGLYNGLFGDNSFMIGILNNIIHGNYHGDAFNKLLPTNYPPLYFWCLGTMARWLHLSALQAWELAPFFLFVMFPVVFFWIGKKIDGTTATGFYVAWSLLLLGNALVLYLFDSPRSFPVMELVILKPYELLAMALAVLWMLRTTQYLQADSRAVGPLLSNGVLGGVIFLLYYPWFVIALAAVSAYSAWCGLRATRRLVFAHQCRLAGIALAAALVSCPYWYPYVGAVAANGTDPNYGSTFPVYKSHFDVTGFSLGMGYFGLLFILGLHGFYKLWRARLPARVLTLLLALCYLWYLAFFVVFALRHVGLLEGKCSIAIFVLLGFGAGFALTQWSRTLPFHWLQNPSTMAVLALFFLPTVFQWNYWTDASIVDATLPLPTSMQNAITRLARQPLDDGYILASLPINTCLPIFLQNRIYLAPRGYAHPVDKYSAKFEHLSVLSHLAGEELQRQLAQLQIKYLLFKKDLKAQTYVLASNRPVNRLSLHAESKFEGICFPSAAFSSDRYTKLYEDDNLILLEL